MSPWAFLRVMNFPSRGVFKQKPKLDLGMVTRAQAGSWQKKVDAAYNVTFESFLKREI